MPRPIAFDLSRMLVGAAGPAPGGIDRVDMDHACHLLEETGREVLGLVPGLGGMGVLDRNATRHFADLVRAHWREHHPASDEAALTSIRDPLKGAAPPTPSEPSRGRPPVIPVAARYASLLLAARSSLFAAAAGAVPKDSILLGIGQTSLRFPALLRWLDRRPDVKPVFMLHDLVPLTHPEFAMPPVACQHARMVETAARRAHAMITTSETAKADLRAALSRLGRHDVRIEVIAQPVDPVFLDPERRPSIELPGDYFVIVGAVDPHKNHRMLLALWRSMAGAGVVNLPKLVIAGARGLRIAETRALLDRSPALRAHVIEAQGLTTPALRDVIAGARGLLAPSFTEGSGLTILEALALGTPVIASDIPAHREVAQGRACLLDPLDGAAWRAAILEPPQRPSPVRPPTWHDSFEMLRTVLDSI